jgi:hypothetical protein
MFEPKFRAWDSINKRMCISIVYLDFASSTKISWTGINPVEDGNTFCQGEHPIDPLMLCSTLRDIEDNDIYDADIIYYNSFYFGDTLEPEGYGLVEWDEAGFSIFKNGDYVLSLFEMIINHSPKIVGNFFENPELHQYILT